MTEPEQQEPEADPQADDSQYQAMVARSGELIEQYFQLFRVIPGGNDVHILPGQRYFISAAMITREEWDTMSSEEQQAACMNELADMLEEASDSMHFTVSNENTRIITGNTTLMMRRDDEIQGP